MSYKNIKLYCRNVGTQTDPWVENYTKDVDDPQAWAQALIDQFNTTLRPNERARELVRVEVESESDVPPEHDWEKENLVTIARGDIAYDILRCKRCGITAKRVGLGGIRNDPAFRAKVYLRCDTSVAHRTKRGILK